jgi:hypothetical protein
MRDTEIAERGKVCFLRPMSERELAPVDGNQSDVGTCFMAFWSRLMASIRIHRQGDPRREFVAIGI